MNLDEALFYIEQLEMRLAYGEKANDATKQASIEELVKQWKELEPLAMVSHAHANYARALVESQERVKELEKLLKVREFNE